MPKLRTRRANNTSAGGRHLLARRGAANQPSACSPSAVEDGWTSVCVEFARQVLVAERPLGKGEVRGATPRAGTNFALHP